MGTIKIGPRKLIGPCEGGGVIALAGELTAIAGASHLVVWSRNRRIGGADAQWPAPGVPRILNDRVLWGPGVLDLRTGSYEVIEASRPEIRPGGGERPCVYAWSTDGTRMVATYATGESDRPTRINLFDSTLGQAIATLWHGNELPPQAAWVGRHLAVLGFCDPRVFDVTNGTSHGAVAVDAGTIVRFDSDFEELRLIAVDLNRSVISIDQREWTVVDRWEGQWYDAVISPDGRFVAALDSSGKLHFACLVQGHFCPIEKASDGARADSIALTNDSIGIVTGGFAMRLSLDVDC